MSEMRRAAKALLEHRTERFESRHGLAASQARLESQLARLGPAATERFRPAWKSEGDVAVLEAHFLPSPRTARLLRMSSIVMALLVAASLWIVLDKGEGAARFLVPLFTVLAVLGFPFVALAMNSQREAVESRIRKAIRVALLDEEQRLPASRQWDDED
jgi:hypothetical protein